ncbi:MAG: UDP-N-acetylmuramate dehydrogenase [Eggerthellaceae bacterium]|nr:UDP-N-acetylmuramate dehydrogenase [Eggerthellaceae bacterium]
MAAQHTSDLEALFADDAFEGEALRGELLSRYTTYRIGGPARFLVRVESLSALSSLVARCEACGLPWSVIGKGSNLLVSDEGFNGVAIVLGGGFRVCRFDEQRSCFVAGAGLALASLVQEAFKRALAGLEFAVGIPGTLGGAIRMNAGSDREWIGSKVYSVTTHSAQKGLSRYLGSDISWGYRTCSLPDDEIVVECEIVLAAALASYIRGKMEASLTKRNKSQPFNQASCGSIFRNPEGFHAAALIEELGLKGQVIGGAAVSQVHANFIVNTGGARAVDVRELIDMIQAKVKEHYGIELQPEVKFLGFA